MTSFYGCNYGGGGGEGGVTDYNQLSNIPIENINNTAINPLVLSELEVGHYMLTGEFYYTLNNPDVITFNKTFVTIVENNGKKYGYFSIIENSVKKNLFVEFVSETEYKIIFDPIIDDNNVNNLTTYSSVKIEALFEESKISSGEWVNS